MTPVDQIKDRLSIVDVVSTYVKLEPAGKNLKAKSPFANEKTPSFFVSPDKGLFHCFSTGKGGDIFTFVQELEGIDFKGALKVLADRAGVSLNKFDTKASDERDRLYAVVERATSFFEEKLKENAEALAYLKDRGVSDESIKEWRIGFAPMGWRNLYEVLQKDFSDKDIVIAGLGKKTEKGIYDTFRDRIMFPICDSAGRPIAFSGRILHPDGKSGKYVNSPDTPLFNKSDVLFGLDKAKHYIRKYNFTTLVEGQFDVLMLHQAGFRNTVGVSGTALSDTLVGQNNGVNNLGLVKRLSDNLVLAFDADSAGIKAAKRSAGIALALGMDVKALSIPGAKDPAEYLQEFGKDGWGKILKEAKHIIEFSTERLRESAKDPRDLGRKIREEVLPDVALIASEIEKDFFIKKIANISGIAEDVLWKELEKINVPVRQEPLSTEEPKDRRSRKASIERKLFALYYASDGTSEIKESLTKIIGPEKFRELDEAMSLQKQELLFEVGEVIDEKETKEMLQNLEEEYLNVAITENKEKLRKAESLNFDEEAESLTSEYQNLSKRLSEIKNSRHLHKY